MYTYTRSIQNDMGGVAPDFLAIKRAVKKHADIMAILHDFGNNGDIVFINFNQEPTADQKAILDDILSPGPSEVIPYTPYGSGQVMADLSGLTLTLVDTSTTQTLTGKTISSGTNVVTANGLFMSGSAEVKSDNSGIPTAGQVLTATSSTTMAFQDPPIPQAIGCLVNYGGGSQVITSRTITPLRFDNSVFDTGLYNVSNHIFTISNGGIYNVNVSAYHKNLTLPILSSTALYCLLYVNGTIADSQFSTIRDSTQSHHFSMYWEMSSGDSMHVSLYSSDVDIVISDTDVVDSISLKGLSSLSVVRL